MAREVYELRVNYNSSFKRVNDLKECLNIDSLLSEIKEMEEETNKEDFWLDNKKAKQVLKKLNKDKNKNTTQHKAISSGNVSCSMITIVPEKYRLTESLAMYSFDFFLSLFLVTSSTNGKLKGNPNTETP